MEQMLWHSVHWAAPRAWHLRSELPREPALTQEDGKALRWLRIRLGQNKFSGCLPDHWKLLFHLSQHAQVRLLERDGGTEDNVPTGREYLCAFHPNESLMVGAQKTSSLGEFCSFPSLAKRLRLTIQMLCMVHTHSSRTEGLWEVGLIFFHFPHGFWKEFLAEGETIDFVDLGTFVHSLWLSVPPKVCFLGYDS